MVGTSPSACARCPGHSPVLPPLDTRSPADATFARPAPRIAPASAPATEPASDRRIVQTDVCTRPKVFRLDRTCNYAMRLSCLAVISQSRRQPPASGRTHVNLHTAPFFIAIDSEELPDNSSEINWLRIGSCPTTSTDAYPFVAIEIFCNAAAAVHSAPNSVSSFTMSP